MSVGRRLDDMKAFEVGGASPPGDGDEETRDKDRRCWRQSSEVAGSMLTTLMGYITRDAPSRLPPNRGVSIQCGGCTAV